MSETDPYADPAAPDVYYPEAEVLKASQEEAAVAATKETTTENPAEPDVEGTVPEGTIAEITEWVGEDTARAARALEAEETGQQRKSLIKTLKSLL